MDFDSGALKASVERQLRDSAEVSLALAAEQSALIAAMASAMSAALRAGGKVVFFGNGGSAADAQHLAAELVGRFRRERVALPALALSTNASVLSAIANDYGYDRVFVRQVEALVGDKDVVVGISTSGRSPNVLAALVAAKARGACCLGLTGRGGREMAAACDLCLLVPADDTARIQEAHITVGHICCDLVEAEFA